MHVSRFLPRKGGVYTCLILLCLFFFVCGFFYKKSLETDNVEAPIVSLVDLPDFNIATSVDKITIDLGKVYFAKVAFNVDAANSGSKIRLKLRESSEPEPLPSIGAERIGVRFYDTEITLKKGSQPVALPPEDARLMPSDIGSVMPFRYIDIYGWKGNFSKQSISIQYARSSAFQQQGKISFTGDPSALELDRIMRLMDHTMMATSFAGIFVDGDRERLPYEADAYINMLGWFAQVGEVSVPRRTFEFLVKNPTWPTEWQSHMILMAWADFMQTGDKEFLRTHYAWLKLLTLKDAISETGMVDISKIKPELKKALKVTYPMGDLVDWPPSQRDGHEMVANNTVTNAFVYESMLRMADIAHALDEESDRQFFTEQAEKLKAAIRGKVTLSNGLFSDGIGSSHTSAHSLFVPLDFGLVNEDERQLFLTEIKKKITAYGGGFPSSVFAAQYLLESLFKMGEDDLALSLILNESDRGWLNMLNKYDATITHEAWDVKFKDNEDWTHAWGAAPANIIPRYLLGVRPTKAGWQNWELAPSRALRFSAVATLPTPKGNIFLNFDYPKRLINVTVPVGSSAKFIHNGQSAELGSGQHQLDWK